VLGHSKFMSRNALMKQFIAEHQGIPLPDNTNAAMSYGTANEPVARKKFERDYKVEVQTHGYFVHSSHEWIGCSPDGTYLAENGEEMLLEIKCPYNGNLPSKIPEQYYDQIQWCLEIMNLEYATLYYWTPEEQVDFEIERDRDYFKSMLDYAYDFMAEFEKKKNEPLEYVNRSKDVLEWANELKRVEDEIKVLKETSAALRQNILEECQPNVDNIIGPLRVQYVKRRGSVNNKAIYADFNVDLDQYRGADSVYTKFTFNKED
jgi:hypothetical protein